MKIDYRSYIYDTTIADFSVFARVLTIVQLSSMHAKFEVIFTTES